MIKSILHVDSRQKHYHKEFGGVDITALADESHFSVGVPNTIEPLGSVACTALSDVKVGTSQTKQLYDYDDLFSRTPHGTNGAYPPDTFGAMVKYGLLRLGTTIRDVLWKSYWRADTFGPNDSFYNTLTSMDKAQSSATAWTNFYANWLPQNLVPGQVLPQGDRIISQHDWVIKDWTTKNGVKYMIVDFHTGFEYLMPQEVFNTEINKTGCGTGIPATQAIQDIERRNFFTWLQDLITNLFLKAKLVQLQVKLEKPMNTQTDNSYKLYNQAKLCLGQQLSQDNAEYGCAITTNAIATKAWGHPIGGGASTHDMYTFLQDTTKYSPITKGNELPGDIIIAPTGYGRTPAEHGHVGVIAKYGIVSNSSEDGRVHEQWTLETWKAYYCDYLKFPYAVFRAI